MSVCGVCYVPLQPVAIDGKIIIVYEVREASTFGCELAIAVHFPLQMMAAARMPKSCHMLACAARQKTFSQLGGFVFVFFAGDSTGGWLLEYFDFFDFTGVGGGFAWGAGGLFTSSAPSTMA